MKTTELRQKIKDIPGQCETIFCERLHHENASWVDFTLSAGSLKDLVASHDRLLAAAKELVRCHKLQAGISMTEALPEMEAAIAEAE